MQEKEKQLRQAEFNVQDAVDSFLKNPKIPESLKKLPDSIKKLLQK